MMTLATNELAKLDDERQPCLEKTFAELLARNLTGNMVADIAQADVLFAPLYTFCFSNQDVRVRFLDEVYQQNVDNKPVTVYASQPWTEQSGLGENILRLVERFPLTLLTPDFPELTGFMAQRTVLGRHVSVPPPPFDYGVVNMSGETWRRYRFCFAGAQTSSLRRTIASSLCSRWDAAVIAPCEKHPHYTNPEFSPNFYAELYSNCDFCFVPLGETMSDFNLREAMRVGCVPAILDTYHALPRQEWTDYSQAIWLVSRQHLATELERMSEVPLAKLQQMRRGALEYAAALSLRECTGSRGLFAIMQRLLPDPQQEADASAGSLVDAEAMPGSTSIFDEPSV